MCTTFRRMDRQTDRQTATLNYEISIMWEQRQGRRDRNMTQGLKPCKPYDDDNNNDYTNPGRHVTRIIKFRTWHLIFVCHQYETCCMSRLCCPEFFDSS